MDTFLQNRFHLPSDVVRIIFEFTNFAHELRAQKRRLRHTNTQVRPYNAVFFRNWFYLIDQVDENGNYTNGRLVIVYF